MAKSRRSTSIKTNNQKLKKNVFGPVEEARAQRLSAKLLEIACQPKPEKLESEKKVEDVEEASTEQNSASATQDQDTMELDSSAKSGQKSALGRKKIEKRRTKKSSIVFSSHRDRQTKKRR